MKSRKLTKTARAIYEKRTAVFYVLLALIFSGVLRSGDQFATLLIVYTAMFWIYSYSELRSRGLISGRSSHLQRQVGLKSPYRRNHLDSPLFPQCE